MKVKIRALKRTRYVTRIDKSKLIEFYSFKPKQISWVEYKMENVHINSYLAVSAEERAAARVLLAHVGEPYSSRDPLKVKQTFETDSGNPVCPTQGTITDVATDQGTLRLLSEKGGQPLAVFNAGQKTMMAVAGTVVATPKPNDGDIFYLAITKPHTPYPELRIVAVGRRVLEAFYKKELSLG